MTIGEERAYVAPLGARRVGTGGFAGKPRADQSLQADQRADPGRAPDLRRTFPRTPRTGSCTRIRSAGVPIYGKSSGSCWTGSTARPRWATIPPSRRSCIPASRSRSIRGSKGTRTSGSGNTTNPPAFPPALRTIPTFLKCASRASGTTAPATDRAYERLGELVGDCARSRARRALSVHHRLGRQA